MEKEAGLVEETGKGGESVVKTQQSIGEKRKKGGEKSEAQISVGGLV